VVREDKSQDSFRKNNVFLADIQAYAVVSSKGLDNQTGALIAFLSK